MKEITNEFYDIGKPGQETAHPMQLKHLGSKIASITYGKRGSNYWGIPAKPSGTYYRDTTVKDYDREFVRKICATYPPYEIELLLDHHYNLYIKSNPEKHTLFQKQIRYVIIPALEKTGKYSVYVELTNEWLKSRKEAQPTNQNSMTINQKLNKILKFIVDHPDRINVDSVLIQKEIFNEEVSTSEAQELYRKLFVSGTVRVIGYRYLAYSTGTKLYLDGGGFGGEYKPVLPPGEKSISPNEENILAMMKAFVTYAWGDIEHEQKVRSFTDYLRKKGIHAEMDVMLSQKETTINFKKMMHFAMQYPKVIVVLSENYKTRADTFAGGVGTEYTMLINDISDNPEKYVLVSFNGRPQNIVPFGLKGNDIVDLSLPDGEETLFRKLTGQHKYVFAEVAPEHPKFESEQIDAFKAMEPQSIISIEEPIVKQGGSHTNGGLYQSIEFNMQLYFKNISGKSLEGFSYDVKLKQQLMPELYDQAAKDGFMIFNEDLSQKIFPNRPTKGKSFKIKINSHLIRQILGTRVTVTVYTDHGEYSREFAVEELFKARPHGNISGDTLPLSLEMFG